MPNVIDECHHATAEDVRPTYDAAAHGLRERQSSECGRRVRKGALVLQRLGVTAASQDGLRLGAWTPQ